MVDSVIRLGLALLAGSLATSAGAAQTCPAGQTPAVVLNHLYGVLDSATVRAIAASPFVTDSLGAYEARTTTSNAGARWTGHYLYGRNTYLELFAPDQRVGAVGAGGVGLGVDCRGGIGLLASRLETVSSERFDTAMRTRTMGGSQVPWFRMGYFAVTDTLPHPVVVWVMEYDPGYIALRDSTTRDSSITRESHLATQYLPERELLGIREATFALPAEEIPRVVHQLVLFGFSAKDLGTGTRLTSPDLTLLLRPARPDYHGLVSLTLDLVNEAQKLLEYRFGTSSILTIGPGRIATWRFTPGQ